MFLDILQAGEVSFPESMKMQMDWLEKKRENRDLPEIVLLLEHPPVFTMGKRALIPPRKSLHEIPVHWTQRSGGLTYHGPGQLILYTLVQLKKNGKTLKDIAHDLEEMALKLFAAYGLSGYRSSAHPGVWVEEKLVAMRGLGSRFDISFHGMAININVDLKPFTYIAPCGLAPGQISSMKALLGKEIPMEEVRQKLVRIIKDVWA